MKEKSEYKTS